MISKSQLSFIRSLHQKKYRLQHQLFIAEGAKIVKELLISNFKVRNVYGTEDFIASLGNVSKVSKNTDFLSIGMGDMERITSLSSASEAFAIVDMKEINQPDISKIAKNELILVLDDVKDPGNLGTIIRIADWFGIKHIVCSFSTVEIYNPKVVQASMGSISRVEVYPAELKVLLSSLSNQIPVYGALLEGNNLYKEQLSTNGLIIMGNESKGISAELLPFINRKIHIPRFGEAESLNVAIATALICSEFRRNW